jgi:hypothetical protein
MYDFYFDTKKEIQKNPENFLLFVKKLLPRWLNGIPDSECLAIFKILNNIRKKKKRNLIAINKVGGLPAQFNIAGSCPAN